MNELIPLNTFESTLADARQGHLSVPQLMRMLVGSVLFVPSATEVMEDGSGFQPLLFDKGNARMLACFSDKSRVGDFSSLAPYGVTMKGRDILVRIPSGYGVVVNPGNLIGFDISPEGIAEVISDFITDQK